MSKKKVEIKPIQESRPYVLWRRCSTEEQGESGLGLEAQLTIAKVFIGKDPIKVFTDVHTGTKLKECKGLWDAIDVCLKNNYVLVIAKSDRLRNVGEAMEVIDAIGERNLIICDIPTTDRFVMTIMFAMWERQAIMIRLNTRIALAERKKQIERDGGFISKSGNWCTHLGNKKGVDQSAAAQAQALKKQEEAKAWREESPLYTWVSLQVMKGRAFYDILADAQALYEKNPEKYCTRTGKALYAPLLSLWRKEILPMR